MFTKINNFIDRYLIQLFCCALLLVGAVAVSWRSIIIKIPVGYAGIIYRPFSGGVDLNVVLGEGLHVVPPWDSITQYNMQILSQTLNMDVITSDLLKSSAVIIFQYQLNKNTLPLLHKYVGPDYLTKILTPAVQSSARVTFGKYTTEQAFTGELAKASREIAKDADNAISATIDPPGLTFIKMIEIPNANVSSITFPEEYEKSINLKLTQSAAAQAFQYKILAAKSEAERLEIEGEGIRKYQQLIQAGLTDNFLRLRGIQATAALAESTNSKIVVFGSTSSSGLPLILGDSPAKK
jgi:regulator of protease activity HflC (stomatin/prohibitin superfamily)